MLILFLGTAIYNGSVPVTCLGARFAPDYDPEVEAEAAGSTFALTPVIRTPLTMASGSLADYSPLTRGAPPTRGMLLGGPDGLARRNTGGF